MAFYLCTDINECESSELNNCDDICINMNGFYQCSCVEGFNLVADGFNSSCEGNVYYHYNYF